MGAMNAQNTDRQNKSNRSAKDHSGPGVYQIRIQGHLDAHWANWFEGLDISQGDRNETRITGTVVDQSALHGLLKKVRDLGLPLISVTRLDDEE